MDGDTSTFLLKFFYAYKNRTYSGNILSAVLYHQAYIPIMIDVIPLTQVRIGIQAD